MQATLKFPFQFDSNRMLAELETIESRYNWLAHPDVTVTNKGDWTSIALISSTGEFTGSESLRYRGNEQDAQPTELLLTSSYLKEVVGSFQTLVHRARLMSLLPGTVIKEHRDYGAQRYSYERNYMRVHIPIRTHEQVAWRLRGQKVPMAPGDAWYINVCQPHSVENLSNVNRVHLVLDIKVNDWVKGFFPEATFGDRAVGLILRNLEPSYLSALAALRGRWQRARRFLGDAGLRKLKYRLNHKAGLEPARPGKAAGG